MTNRNYSLQDVWHILKDGVPTIKAREKFIDPSGKEHTGALSGDFGGTNIVATGGTSQSIASATVTKAQFDQARETDPNLTADLTNNQLVIENDGGYMLYGAAYFRNDTGWSTGDAAHVRVAINGNYITAANQRKVSTSAEMFRPTPTFKNLVSGDAITLQVFQNSGVSQQIRQNDFAVLMGGVRLQ